MVVITWNETSRTSVLLTKDDGSLLTLSVGDFIGHDNSTYGAVIVEFTGTDPEGPIGMIYLSRKIDRWAKREFGIRGDPRHAICHPVGLPHYGVHPNWNSVFIKGPCPDEEWKSQF